MKILKYILSTLILVAVVWSCTDNDFDDLSFLEKGKAPENVSASFNVTQDNTGMVTITPNSEGAVSYEVYFGDETAEPAKVKQGASVTHIYAEGTYAVRIVAIGITGLKSETSEPIALDVSFKAPEDLVVEITNDPAVSKQVNVVATATYGISFDVYFGEEGNDEPVTANIGEMASYIYQEPGVYTIRVVAKSAAIQTTEITQEFEAFAIVQPIESAPTPPSRLDADVISIYGDAYTNIPGTNYNPDWGQSGQGSGFAEFDLNGDKMLQYINLSYQGIGIGETIDVSGMEFLHLDVWTADVTKMETSLINGQDGNSTEKPVWSDLTADQWTSIDIPIADYVDQGLTVNEIFQLKFVGDPWAGGTVFIDNIYFHRAPTELATLPINFDSAAHTFEAFLDAEFAISADPDDANNPVGMITNHGQGWGWEGVKLAMDEWIDVSVYTTLKLDFYNDGAAHTVLMKLEDSTSEKDGNGNPTVFEEVWVDVSGSGWTELAFNFTSGGNYDTVVLFVDGGVYDITGTYYFDNVRQVGAVLPITFDTDLQTFEAFLDAEFAISVDPDDANNPVGMITNHGQGWGWEGIKLPLDEWLDLSSNTTIKLDFYTSTEPHSVMMKLEDSTSEKDGNGNPTVFEEVWLDVSTTGWSELSFDFTSGGQYDTVVLFVDGGVYDITGTYYIDNITQPTN